MKRPHDINMTRGPLFREIMEFMIPLLLSALLQIAFNAADLIVVGRFGRPTALAAVGSNGSLVNLVVNVLMGLSTGGGVLVARFYGAGDTQKLHRTVTTSLTVGAVGGVLFGILGAGLAVPLLRLISSPPEVLPLAALYLRIYFAGMPVIALYNFAGAALRSTGNTTQPLVYLAIAGALNVVLNLVFVIGLGIDVAGVALATVLSQCVSCFLTVRCLIRSLHLTRKEMSFSRRAFKQMLSIGLPAGIQGSLFSVSNFLIQASINSFGAAVMAGNSACVSVEGFLLCHQDVMSQTATTAISQNVGAQQKERARLVTRYCLLIGAAISLVGSAFIVIFRRPILGIYTSDEAALEAAYTRIFVMFTTNVIGGVMNTMNGVLRGLGHSLVPAAVTFTGVCVLRIVWIATIFAAHRSLWVLYASYPVSWALTGAVLLGCYFKLRDTPFKSQTP